MNSSSLENRFLSPLLSFPIFFSIFITFCDFLNKYYTTHIPQYSTPHTHVAQTLTHTRSLYLSLSLSHTHTHTHTYTCTHTLRNSISIVLDIDCNQLNLNIISHHTTTQLEP